MLDRDTWEFINSFAPWLAALGTFLAVATSLYLARRDRVVRLAIRAGIRKIVLSGLSIAQGQDVVCISVTNIGSRGALITGIFWKAGILRPDVFEQVPPSSVQMPVKLSDGDEVVFRFPMRQFEQGVLAIIGRLAAKPFLTLQARSIKAGVYTSAAGSFMTTAEKRLQQWFLKATLEHRKKQSAS